MTQQLPQIRMDYFALAGGLNQMTPPLVLPPGFATEAQNFECDTNGGYRRISGYERFDGHDRPSEQTFYTLPATITGAWAVGDTITGATSGATATVIGENNGVGFFVCKISGTFNGTESLTISATPAATNTAAAYRGGATSMAIEAMMTDATASVYRALISAVPGAGPIRGVTVFNDVVYAFRNNSLNTLCEMYKSTTGGWSKVTFGYQISFGTGSGAITDGQTGTGATSGASAVVKRVLRRSGAWSGTAAGTLVFASITGTFQSGENLQVGGVTKAVSTSVATAITLAPGGRFEFVTYNFFGAAGTKRLYGCDGKNPAFEWDGTTFVPILTGMTTDTPTHIAAHKQHLFLAFDSSLQHSGINDAYAWSPVLGAGELALGDTITNLRAHVGDASNAALVATTRNHIKVLYGTSSSDWQLISTETEIGAYPYTAQRLRYMFWLDDRGLTSMEAGQDFGNFGQAAISSGIRKWIMERLTLSTESCIVRELNQYRLFFSDKAALYVTYSGGKLSGIMPMLYAHDVTCCWSSEWNNGTERIFFGSSDGFVREMECGTSFDGEPIEFYFRTAWNHIKSPNVTKRFWRALLEMQGEGYIEMNFGYELGYGLPSINQPVPELTSVMAFSPAAWDSFVWYAFVWDGKTLAPVGISITGTAENISIGVSGRSTYVAPFTVTGIIIHHTLRRRLR